MYLSSIKYFFHFLPFLRMEALYHMMTFFDATDCTNGTFSQLLCPELEEEIIRRHVLWRNGCELRSVLTDSGDFVTIMACTGSCESFSGGRYVRLQCDHFYQSTLVLIFVILFIQQIDIEVVSVSLKPFNYKKISLFVFLLIINFLIMY